MNATPIAHLLEDPDFLRGFIAAAVAVGAVILWVQGRRLERAAKIAADVARDFRLIVNGRAADMERFEKIETRLDKLEAKHAHGDHHHPTGPEVP